VADERRMLAERIIATANKIEFGGEGDNE